MRLPPTASSAAPVSSAAATPAFDGVSRRALIQTLPLLFSAAAVSTTGAPAHAAGVLAPPPSLTDAGWLPMTTYAEANSVSAAAASFPEPFVMYLSRFLLRYDQNSASWLGTATAALPASWSAAKRQEVLAGSLGAFGNSLSFRLSPLAAAGAAGAAQLFESLNAAYARDDAEVRGQLALLFSLLTPSLQPVEAIKAALSARPVGGEPPLAEEVLSAMAANADALLPTTVRPEWDESRRGFFLPEPLRSTLLGSLATSSDASSSSSSSGGGGGSSRVFGEMGRAPLSTERTLAAATYGLFALSGGAGCSMTHLAVVPLDVVKTRLQTRPGAYSGFADGLMTIQREEGLGMLFQGAQATGAGYFMYGVSVYPGYELAKRVLFELAGPTGVLEARIPLVLLAGALATIVTCFLITPFEALRIRMVECPGYAPNFAAAYKRYVSEGGWLSLYDGIIPLLVRQVRVACLPTPVTHRDATAHTSASAPLSRSPLQPLSPASLSPSRFPRPCLALPSPCPRTHPHVANPSHRPQVLFGMVKFLIFDYCADAIVAALPAGTDLESALVTIGVPLLSGTIAGVCAAVVSQPADVVLSKVAQGDGSVQEVGRLPGGVNQLALLQQAAGAIIRKYGLQGLYLGLPSRCLWSGAIIAGQFTLYDIFKQALHVTAADLTLFYDALGASAAGAAIVGGG